MWPFTDSAPEHHIDLRTVSLEPGHGEGHKLKIFFEKWLVAKLPIKKIHQCFPWAQVLFITVIYRAIVAIKALYFAVLWTGQLSS